MGPGDETVLRIRPLPSAAQDIVHGRDALHYASVGEACRNDR